MCTHPVVVFQLPAQFETSKWFHKVDVRFVAVNGQIKTP